MGPIPRSVVASQTGSSTEYRGRLLLLLLAGQPDTEQPIAADQDENSVKKTVLYSVGILALGEKEKNEIKRFIEDQPPFTARERVIYQVRFLVGVGLRSS